jgi:hypothetical protein
MALKEVTFHIIVEVEDKGQLDEMYMKEALMAAYFKAKAEGAITHPTDTSTIIVREAFSWHDTWEVVK